MIKDAISRIHPLKREYLLTCFLLLGIYLVGAMLLTTFFQFPETGAADYDRLGLSDLDQPPVHGLVIPGEIVEAYCPPESHSKVIFVPDVEDYPIYAVYCPGVLGPATEFSLFNARNGAEISVTDTGGRLLYQELGVWKYVGIVKSNLELVLGAGVLVAICILGYAQMRQRAFDSVNIPFTVATIWVILGAIAFGVISVVLPCITVPLGLLLGWRLRSWAYTVINFWLIAILVVLLMVVVVYGDPWGMWVTLILGITLGVVGWRIFFPLERLVEAFSINPPTPIAGLAQSPTAIPGLAPQPTSNSATPPAANPPATFTVIPPDKLPNFNKVGGMEAVKKELRDTVGLMLAFGDEAESYNISWNGFLLHGPPGTGKSFIARAIAGEFGLNFIPVSPSELTTSYLGESARLITKVFEFAHDHAPCLLFFDEFDSLAAERDRGIDPERRSMVNQLLRSLEESRDEQDVIVAAATNDLEHLDPAVIRPGRFDYHVHIGYPDQAARRAIFASQLADLPTESDIDLDDLARRLDGSSAADIAQIVRKTALNVFREKVQKEQMSEAPLTQAALLAMIANKGGHDRPTNGRLKWDEVILSEDTKSELIELQRMIENPELGHTLGVQPPSGVLLYGPPGTGKTTIARVLASESRTSFFPVSAADILTSWFGESERNIKKLFDRARRNRPSIIFIDELDAIAQRRTGFANIQDSILNQLLHEMDGMSTTPGVFVLGATNRPEILDPALLRGGRLSRQILIPLPDEKGRAKLFQLMTASMPLAKDVTLQAYAGEATQGYSGADIEALCQQAAQAAFSRVHATESAGSIRVESADFDNALADYQQQRAARSQEEGE